MTKRAKLGPVVPPPLMIFARLVMSALAVLLLEVGVFWLTAPALLGTGRTGRAPIVFLSWLTLLSHFLAWPIAAWWFLLRITPIYSALHRARVLEFGQERTPPSQAAVRDAFLLPGPSVVYTCLGVTLIVYVSGILWAAAQTLPLGLMLAVLLYYTAVVMLGAFPILMLWRQAIWHWVGYLKPSEVPVASRRGVTPRFIWPAVLSLTAAVFAGTSLILSRLALHSLGSGSHVTWWFVLMVGLACTLLSALPVGLSARYGGRRTSLDLLDLTHQITRFATTSSTPVRLGILRFSSSGLTDVADDLAEALSLVAKRVYEITQQEEQARLAVEEAQRLKTQFMASMSHDLRSPLNSVIGFTDLLLQGVDGPLNQAQQESATMIRRSGEELLGLLTNILDSARVEAGRMEIRREWTPSVTILTESVRRGRELIAGKPLEISVELQPGLPPLFVDAERITQAILGLFSHAAAAMTSGKIRMVARLTSGPPGPRMQVRIDVTDSGAGIREGDRTRVFQAFEPVADPSGRRIGGLGLGLSLARTLVLEHGGEVWSESRAGAGTTFSIALPTDGP